MKACRKTARETWRRPAQWRRKLNQPKSDIFEKLKRKISEIEAGMKMASSA
jgi:hypothetical protein